LALWRPASAPFLREIARSNGVQTVVPNNEFSLRAGSALIVAGIIVLVCAALRHYRYVQALDRGQLNPAQRAGFSPLVAGFLALTGLAVAVYRACFLKSTSTAAPGLPGRAQGSFRCGLRW